MNDNFDFITDINYSNEDIKELVEDRPNNYVSIGAYTSVLLLSFCNATATDSHGNHGNFHVQSKPEFEVIFNNDFHLEDYQNVFLVDDYSLWSNVNQEDKKKSFIETILSFKSLKESWDGFGALPLEIGSATNAIVFLQTLDSKINFINPADVSPNPNGTVSLIWENVDERLSIEIGNTSMSYYTKFNNSAPEFFNNLFVTESNIEDISRKIKALF